MTGWDYGWGRTVAIEGWMRKLARAVDLLRFEKTEGMLVV